MLLGTTMPASASQLPLMSPVKYVPVGAPVALPAEHPASLGCRGLVRKEFDVPGPHHAGEGGSERVGSITVLPLEAQPELQRQPEQHGAVQRGVRPAFGSKIRKCCKR